MTNTSTDEGHIARRKWLAVLARASRDELETAFAGIAEMSSLEYVRPSEPGMVMLRGRVGGTGDAFNLGEASVTRCAVRMGSGPLGVGYTLGRDRRKAELVAVFDALLQDDSRHAEIQREVVGVMALRQAAQRAVTSRSVATSKVEFFTFVRGQA
jgi:alpha-D-ribose 1-methylphosphonate 5-triphosphate synthase subunit PhnG